MAMVERQLHPVLQEHQFILGIYFAIMVSQQQPTSLEDPAIWKIFAYGALAGVVGESIMHPVDTLKTRIQSGGHFGVGTQIQNNIRQALRSILATDGVKGLYRGVGPGLTGSFVTGATYFGFIEMTKDHLHYSWPTLAGPWADFMAGATGEMVGSIVYVPCEVIKQRMQVQGSMTSWKAAIKRPHSTASKPSVPTYQFYSGIFHAGSSILRNEGIRGLYAGYFSTLGRDVPFAGLQWMFYEGLKEVVQIGYGGWRSNTTNHEFDSLEELFMGGIAGGISAFLTNPMDIIKTRLQVQGSFPRYAGWLDALQKIWREEALKGFFRGYGPRVMWTVPSSALTIMTFEGLRRQFS